MVDDCLRSAVEGGGQKGGGGGQKGLGLRRVHRDRRGGDALDERGRPTSGSGNRVGEAWGANAGGSPGGGFGMDFWCYGR